MGSFKDFEQHTKRLDSSAHNVCGERDDKSNYSLLSAHDLYWRASSPNGNHGYILKTCDDQLPGFFMDIFNLS